MQTIATLNPFFSHLEQFCRPVVQKREALINKVIAANARVASAKSLLAIARVEIIKELGYGVFETEHGKVTVREIDFPVFDAAAAKTFLTPPPASD